MESYEATRLVFSRIQSLDPENASKIMGVLLIQDHGDKDMIRLAYGPDSLLHSVIVKAKNHLVISSNNSCALPTTPTNPAIPSRVLPSNGFTRPSPLAISPSPPSPGAYSPWSLSGLSENLRSPGGGGAVGSISSPSYAAVVNGTNGNIGNSIMSNGSFSYSNSSNSSSSISHFNNTSSTCGLNLNVNVNDIVDDYTLQEHQFSFLNDSQSEMMKNPLSRSDSMGFNSYMNSNWVDSLNGHRRSCSVNDVCFGSDESASGFGWKPCLYFARGFCKNGSTCRFVHGGFGESSDSSSATIGSPSKLDGFEQCHELLLRSKAAAAAAAAAQQQRLAATSQLMAAGVSFPYNKCMNLLDSPRSAAAALMMGEELPRFARCRSERNDFSAMALGGMMNSSSRQIYLTFPADSTFREEDVSNYFSIYGPVQDVRIPYQQKRMFGFVTFVYPETVKLILAKGNPHFVCESRVLVKPYKEKGKIPEKKHQHQQQLERGEFSSCSSPTGLDSRDPYDLQLGARMFYNTQEMLLRRKLEEQADLQQAIEFQGRRLMNLQLLDLKNHHQSNIPIPSPTSSHTHINRTLSLQSDGQESPEEGDSVSPNAVVADQLPEEVNTSCNQDNGNGNSNEESSNFEESDLPECLEHILPDSLFASPTKLAGNRGAVFSTTLADSDESTSSSTTTSNNNPSMPATSNLNMASLKSCFMQMPRFSSENGAIGM